MKFLHCLTSLFKPSNPKRSTRAARSHAGQSLAELALMLPMLMLVLLGTLDLGRLLDAYVVMTNAAREGARYGSSNPTATSEIRNRAVAEANGSGYNDLTTGMISVSMPDGAGAGNRIVVSISYPFTMFTTYIFGIQTITVQTSATMAMFQ